MRALLPATLLACCAGLTAAAGFPAHPFVSINAAELSTLRTELRQPGWKKELYAVAYHPDILPPGAGIHANAEYWLGQKIVIPARGGYGHNFFCKDGDELEFPPGQVFIPGPYRCPKCHRTYGGEKYEGTLRFYDHLWLAAGAHDLALAAALEQNPAYAAKAAELLLDYAAAYPGPHTTKTAGGILYQSLDESMWVISLAQAYDLIYDDLAPAQRATIEKFLRAVAGGLMQCGLGGNWGSWHLSAVGVVGYAIGDKAMVDWATTQFKEQIRDQLGHDGLWPESIHTYHFFALRAFCFFAEAAWHAGADLYHWEARPGQSLLAMFKAPLFDTYPDGRLPAINDGWFHSPLPLDFYELACCRTHDPRFAATLEQFHHSRNGIYAFLFGKDLTDKPAPLSLSSTNFASYGLGVLRSSNAMLTFHYGAFLGHGHLDKMGITLFANGRLWVADYGTPGYGSAILPWYKSTFAHNTIVIDGARQQPTTERAADSWLADNLIESMRSSTSQAYPGVTHTRTVARVGDCFIIRDQLQSDTEHDYDFYLHSEGRLRLGSVPGSFQKASPPVPWIQNLTEAHAGSSIWADWRIKNDELDVKVIADHSLEVFKGECPAESGSRTIPILIARQKAKTAEFMTVLFPCHKGSTHEAHWDGSTLTMTKDGSTNRIAFGKAEGRPLLINNIN